MSPGPLAAAAGCLALAAAGQLLLERARTTAQPVSPAAAVALLASAGLAVAAFRRSGELPEAPRALEVPRHRRTLYVASVPGAIALLLALGVHLRAPSGSAASAALWVLGLALLLLPGALDLARRTRHRPPEARRESRRFLAAGAALFAVAFSVRTVGGIDRVPGWIDSDEAATQIAGRTSLAEGPRTLFAFSEMGGTAVTGLVSIPRMAFFVSRLAGLPFGDGLEALRLGSAFLGSLTVVFLFDFARRLVGSGTAFVAALLLSVNHAFLHYTRVGQIYVDTPFFASLALALLLRALTGGSFLSLTGAGIALGVGAVTYLPTAVLPAVVAAVVVGWAIILRWPPKEAIAVLGFLAVVVALTCAPVVATAFQMGPEIAYQRVPEVSLIRPDGLRQLRDAYGPGSAPAALGEHVLRSIGFFNFGRDHFKAYGADRAVLDPVTAALIPAAFALLLIRLSTPIGWLCIVFTGAYLSGSVLLCAGPPTYHRALVLVLFSSLAAAWAATGFARVLTAGARASRWLRIALLLLFVGASAWLNLDHYFREGPGPRQQNAGAGFERKSEGRVLPG